LQVAEQQFLRNKCYAEVHHVVATGGLKHALECFALNFDKAVEIIRWDVNKTMCSIVHELTHVKRFHSCCLAGPNDSKQPPRSTSIGLSFELTDYS
jgi:hypothetical protein